MVKIRQGSPGSCQKKNTEIRGHEKVMFRYVKSKDNPGDIASRGTSLKGLNDNQLWRFGPEWLTKPD